MTHAQQVQEESTNRHRQQSPNYRVGDKVWLNLTNILTNYASKKLDAKHTKFTVIEVIGSHSNRLNVPPGIGGVFYSRLLRPTANDPLPSQVRDDSQPRPQLVDDEEEWEIEEILDEKTVRYGRTCIEKRRFLVKWISYPSPTWEPYKSLEDTAALTRWEDKRG
jgi:hypothetical protein